jgi:hypothetical protein
MDSILNTTNLDIESSVSSIQPWVRRLLRSQLILILQPFFVASMSTLAAQAVGRLRAHLSEIPLRPATLRAQLTRAGQDVWVNVTKDMTETQAGMN